MAHYKVEQIKNVFIMIRELMVQSRLFHHRSLTLAFESLFCIAIIVSIRLIPIFYFIYLCNIFVSYTCFVYWYFNFLYDELLTIIVIQKVKMKKDISVIPSIIFCYSFKIISDRKMNYFKMSNIYCSTLLLS